MASSDGSHADVAGGLARHIPVMLPEVLEALSPQSGDLVIDGTFGAGGYTRGILAAGADVIAIDRDPDAIAGGQALVDEMAGRLRLVHGRFGLLDEHAEALGEAAVDGVVLDIGVSSMQLDQAMRGFSFRFDGPLDMRMAQEGLSAADVVNRMPFAALARIISAFGEEKKAKLVARAIEKARADKPFETTGELASLIDKTIGRGWKDTIHPATRTFQALRIYVNRELNELVDALLAAERVLKPGGRLVVVTFHSLEDRIVKRFFADRSRVQAGGSRFAPEEAIEPATFSLISRKAVEASGDEASVNPRARSAKLRAGLRADALARGAELKALGVPAVPDFDSVSDQDATGGRSGKGKGRR